MADHDCTVHAAEVIFERIKAADRNIDRLKTRSGDRFLVLRAEDHRVGLTDALHAIGWRVDYKHLLAGDLRRIERGGGNG